MSDRPTTPDPEQPRQPGRAPAPGPDETSVLPQAGQGAGATPAPSGPLPPQQPAATPPGAGWQAAPTAAAAAPPPSSSGPGRWWGEATSTGGGRAALLIAAVFGTLLLVTGIGLTAALVVGHDRWDGDDRASVSERYGPMMGNGNGRGLGKGQDKWRGPGNRQQDEDVPGTPMGPQNRGNGNGLGMGMGMGAAALAGILHGEYTTNVTGTPTVMVVQLGEVTAYTAGTSMTVKSTDGFEATYALDGATATRTGTPVATGVQVRVLAAKDGMKVTALMVVG